MRDDTRGGTHGPDDHVYSDPGALAGMIAFFTTYAFIMLIFAVIMIIAYWKVFTKAGEAGWQSIIPIWNVIVLLKIAGPARGGGSC